MAVLHYALVMISLIASFTVGAFAHHPNHSHHAQPERINWQQRNYDTVRSIYNMTIYPHNQAFIKEGAKAVPKGLFAPEATGRITPIGNFSGFEDSVEYFFGLTPPVQAPLFDTWTNAKIVSFTSGCPEVASSVVYGQTTGVNPRMQATFGKTITTIKQVAFWRFDENGAVIAYDAWLPTLTRYTEKLFGTTPTDQFKQATIEQICYEQQAICVGANQQFKSTRECVSQLSRKQFGNWDEAWGDNIVCRSLHVLLAKLRPNVHCVHVGPTGGGKCVDVDYNAVYFDDKELFGAPSGDTFTCPNVIMH